jgi:hypothetical protein
MSKLPVYTLHFKGTILFDGFEDDRVVSTNFLGTYQHNVSNEPRAMALKN